ncbi:MFS transporter [Actinacidiphila bryophytorum]|uniref:Drug resistance transporter, EmrB/QacA subfamily n=2 Tax=Actinacidiphila bryophytorum TaxID=1436133 RepID=A0A9W4DYU4_9ACTN|nr:MFS transporter [Actinacidiphila bryophytorum]MBM9436433.1 MFS transporter [Actinacidiphila bryophytorum]CAG7601655.1 Drug resistance transporter, EmrB/QacA subfamily [Actinacidiphila bryophytorum]
MSTHVVQDQTSTTRAPAPSGVHSFFALAAILGTQLMLLLDATVVNVALPGIGSHLGFSPTGMSWVLNVYTLAFGGLLLLGSRIGDLIGRRTALVWGVAAFTLASIAGGVANDSTTLLVARGFQGAAAALAAPSTLALIATSFREGSERNRALSVFSAISGAGSAVGLTVGGMLTDWGSWRWVFFVNIPVGIAIVLLAPRYIKETERHRGGRFDIAGALTGTLGMASLVYAFIRVGESSWGDTRAVTTFVIALALLAAFLVNETRVERPLVVLRLFANRNRALAYAVMLLMVAGMFGTFYFSTQYLQTFLGYSPLKTGFAFLPLAGPLFVAARIAPRALARFGAKRVATVGSSLTLVAAIWITQLSASDGYAQGILPTLILMGVGMGWTVMPLNTFILSGVEPKDAGSASGLLQTMQQVGGSLGLSVLVTVFGTVSRHHPADPFIEGATAAWTLSAVFTGVALLLVLSLKQPKANVLR